MAVVALADVVVALSAAIVVTVFLVGAVAGEVVDLLDLLAVVKKGMVGRGGDVIWRRGDESGRCGNE